MWHVPLRRVDAMALHQQPCRACAATISFPARTVIRRKPAVRSSHSRPHGGTCRILAGYRSLPIRDTVGHINRIQHIRTVARHTFGAAGFPHNNCGPPAGGGLSKHRAFPIGCEMKTPRLLQGRRGPVLSVFLLLLIAACVAYWQLRPAAPSTPATGAAASMLEALQESTAPWQANRRDLSVLLADLRGASIASAALGKDAVYVSLHDGLRYWVPDQSGRSATRRTAGHGRPPIVPSRIVPRWIARFGTSPFVGPDLPVLGFEPPRSVRHVRLLRRKNRAPLGGIPRFHSRAW